MSIWARMFRCLPPASSGSSVAISPDGTRLAYVSGTPARLFIRRLDQPRATELPGTQGANYPFFSPDGQWVGFSSAGKLNKISVEGGAVVPLGDVVQLWRRELGRGRQHHRERGVREGPAADSRRWRRTRDRRGNGQGRTRSLTPQILPGGKAILFTAVTVRDVDQYTIEVLTLADRHRKIVARGGTSARYVAAPGGPAI